VNPGSVVMCSLACYPTVFEGWGNAASEKRMMLKEEWGVEIPPDNMELNEAVEAWIAVGLVAGDERKAVNAIAQAGLDGVANHPYIIGQIVGRMMYTHFINDGWNQMGSKIWDPKTKEAVPCTGHCRPFQDPTGYQPVDDPRKKGDWEWAPESYKCEGDCTRWQPLLEADGYGSLKKQEFVTPFIGTEAEWYLRDPKSQAHLETPVYDYRSESLDVIDRLKDTASSEDRKKAIKFHDNKLFVRGAFQQPIWLRHLSREHSFQDHILYLWGMSLAEYDGVLHGWYEKRHHDLVRPTTIIKSWGDEDIVSYAGMEYDEPKSMKARDFEATIRVMPHGEHPSGSSCLCSSYQEFADLFTETRYNMKLENIKHHSTIGVHNWDNYEHLSEECGESRLWGGLHYPKSIEDGVKVCEGLGTLAYEKITLMKGDNDWMNDPWYYGDEPAQCSEVNQRG